MKFDNVCIEGLGYVVPDQVVATRWMEEQLAPLYQVLGLSPGLIERLTGVNAVRWWPEEQTIAGGATEAARIAIARAGVLTEQIGCVVNTSITRDYIEPSMASFVHNNLDLKPECMPFDVVNACLGFLNGIVVVANMIELGQIASGVVVSAESPREGQLHTIQRLLNTMPDKSSLRNDLASFTLGAGAVAMVLSHRSVSRKGHRIVGGTSYANSAQNQLCLAQAEWMRTQSAELLHEGTEVLARAWSAFAAKFQWDPASVRHAFTHQVSEAQRAVARKRLGFGDIDHPTLSWLGNTASVAAPICMAIAEEQEVIGPGERVMLFGVGSGINSIVLGIEW